VDAPSLELDNVNFLAVCASAVVDRQSTTSVKAEFLIVFIVLPIVFISFILFSNISFYSVQNYYFISK
jgi:hypothetical protein